MTKKATIDHWKGKLGSNVGWAVRGLMAIYKNQTDEEKNTKATLESNGLGFTGFDAELLTGIAEQYKITGALYPGQKRVLLKRMPKYANQLYKEYGK